MKEIWIPESIMVVFFALPLLRPLVKAFWEIDGLVWLLLLGLGIAAGIFPAYGFRPECLPMLAFAICINFMHISSFISSSVSRSSDDFHERGFAFTGISLALLAAAAWVMFAFAPAVSFGLATDGLTTGGLATGSLTVEGVEMKTLRDTVRKENFFLRVYTGTVDSAADTAIHRDTVRPVIFLVPPEAGSVQAVDRVCAALRERGFTVVTYSRPGFDSPATGETGRKHPAALARRRSFWRAFRTGTTHAAANELGKTIEAERRNDLEFLLPRVMALWGNAGRLSGTPLILAGYGAGGSALLALSEDSGFTARYRNIKGIVAIESQLWSAYQAAQPAPLALPPGANRFQRWRAQLSSRLDALKPKKTGALGTLPKPGLPVLYLVSDKALHGRRGQAPYRAVLTMQREYSPVPSALAALSGAGPLDYCDYALSYPLYSFFFPGWRHAPKSKNPVEDTASLMGNFARMLLEREQAAAEGENPQPFAPRVILPEKRSIDGEVYLENRGLPQF